LLWRHLKYQMLYCEINSPYTKKSLIELPVNNSVWSILVVVVRIMLKQNNRFNL